MSAPIRRPCTTPDEDCPDFAVDGTDRCLVHQQSIPRPAHEHDWVTVPTGDGPGHQACRGCTTTRPPSRAYGPDCTGASPHTPVDAPPWPEPTHIPARPYDGEDTPVGEPVRFDEPPPRGWLARAITWTASW